MGLKAPRELIDKLDNIYAAHLESSMYSEFKYQINKQLHYVEDIMNARSWEFNVLHIKQNCFNLHLTVTGDPDEIAAMDANLLREQEIKRYSHCVVLIGDK